MSSIDKLVREEVQRHYNKSVRKSKGELNEYPSDAELRSKYGVSEADLKKVQSKQAEDLDLVDGKIKAFSNYIYNKYGVENHSVDSIVKSAKNELSTPHVKNRYQINSDREFHLFVEYYTHMMGKRGGALPGNQTRSVINQKLGGIVWPGLKASKLDVKGDDAKIVEQIAMLADTGRLYHSVSCYQNMVYSDLDCQNATYDGSYDRISCATHPLIVALFTPKIKVLEDRFLGTFLAGVVKDRMQGMPIRSRPDFELYVDLCNDRNDAVCSGGNVYEDLHKRVVVQRNLRNSVYNMRQGLFFRCDSAGFLMSIDQCKQSPYDAPHLLYGQDEATILRRLLNIMSFRPTHVSVLPLNVMPNVPVPHPMVYQLPMISCNIPSYRSIEVIQQRGAGSTFNPSILPNGFNTYGGGISTAQHTMFQYHVVGGVAQPMRQAIMYTRDVIFFYVNRRMNAIHPHLVQYEFLRMPMSVTGLKKINYLCVDVPPVLKGNDSDSKGNEQPFYQGDGNEYQLRSVVCVRPHPKDHMYAAGCFTLVFGREGTTSPNASKYGKALVYDPLGMKYSGGNRDIKYKYVDPSSTTSTATTTSTPKTLVVTPYPNKVFGTSSDTDIILKSHGTIYVYAKKESENSYNPYSFAGEGNENMIGEVHVEEGVEDVRTTVLRPSAVTVEYLDDAILTDGYGDIIRFNTSTSVWEMTYDAAAASKFAAGLNLDLLQAIEDNPRKTFKFPLKITNKTAINLMVSFKEALKAFHNVNVVNVV